MKCTVCSSTPPADSEHIYTHIYTCTLIDVHTHVGRVHTWNVQALGMAFKLGGTHTNVPGCHFDCRLICALLFYDCNHIVT